MANGNAGAGGADRGVAALGTLAGLGALFSAIACCVLPLALAALGLGAGGLAFFVPFHWPLTIAAGAVVTIGWLLHARRRRTCALDPACAGAPPRKSTLVMLCAATVMVVISSLWSFIEEPLMRLLGGA